MTAVAAPVSTSSITTATVRNRRRPTLTIAGVLLTVVAAAGAGWAVLQAQHTERLLGIARPVEAGRRIGPQDLRYVDLPAGQVGAGWPGAQPSDVIGLVAAVRLLPGQLLVPEAVTDSLAPTTGSALVGVTVEIGRAPAVALEPGDRILVVSTPAEQDDPPPSTVRPDALAATVVSTEDLVDSGRLLLNVEVAAPQAGLLAARAATGRIAVVLLPRGE